MNKQDQPILYPNFENPLKKEIDFLMNEWKDYCGIRSDWFSSDGFYPYYTKQRYRILFVGRESRGLGGRDYITVLYNAYKGLDGKGQRIGGTPMNRLAFHRRLFFLAYGILNDFPDFYCISKSNILAKTFATEEGISFSFMEISKISNPSDDDSSSNWNNIRKSIKSATSDGRNFIRDEINLLSPNIIIGSGIYDLHEIIQHTNAERLDENVFLLKNLSNKNVLYLPIYHFSARNVGDVYYYRVIKESFKKFRCRL